MNFSKHKTSNESECIQIHITKDNKCIIQSLPNKNKKSQKSSPNEFIKNSEKNEHDDFNYLNYLNYFNSDELMNLSVTQNEINQNNNISNKKNKILNNKTKKDNDENEDNILINFSELLNTTKSNENLNLITNTMNLNKDKSNKNDNSNNDSIKNNNNSKILNKQVISHIINNKKINTYKSSINNSNINEEEKEKINYEKRIPINDKINGKKTNLYNYDNFSLEVKNNNNNNKINNDIKPYINNDYNTKDDLNSHKNSKIMKENLNLNHVNILSVNKVKIQNKKNLTIKKQIKRAKSLCNNEEKKIIVNKVYLHKSKNTEKIEKNIINKNQNKDNKIKFSKKLEYNKMFIKIKNNKNKKNNKKNSINSTNSTKNNSYYLMPLKNLDCSGMSCMMTKNNNDNKEKNKPIYINTYNNKLSGELDQRSNKNKNKTSYNKYINMRRNSKGSNNYFNGSIGGHLNTETIIHVSNRKSELKDRNENLLKIKAYKSRIKERKNIKTRFDGYLSKKFNEVKNYSHDKIFDSYHKNNILYRNDTIVNKSNTLNKTLIYRNKVIEQEGKLNSRSYSMESDNINKLNKPKEKKEKKNEENYKKLTKNNSSKTTFINNTLKKSKSGKNNIKFPLYFIDSILKRSNCKTGKLSMNKDLNINKSKTVKIEVELKKLNVKKIRNNKNIKSLLNVKINRNNNNKNKKEEINKKNINNHNNHLTALECRNHSQKNSIFNNNCLLKNILSNENSNTSSLFNNSSKKNYYNINTYSERNRETPKSNKSGLNKYLKKPKEFIKNFSNYKKKEKK